MQWWIAKVRSDPRKFLGIAKAVLARVETNTCSSLRSGGAGGDGASAVALFPCPTCSLSFNSRQALAVHAHMTHSCYAH
eukprot:7591225-Karenia_brevis.AAC.1